MQADTETNIRERNRFPAAVNGQTIDFGDPMPDARQILNAANFTPADECVLIQIFNHGARAIGLDETVDLRESGIESFSAFRADRIYRFTVDERGFDWGEGKIKEPVLRAIAHVKDDEVIVLDRQDQPDEELGPEEEVLLSDAGTEHLRVEKRLVTVYFKEDPFRLARGIYTTEQLMAIFPIEQGYLLNLRTEDGELVTLKPGQKTRLKDGMHFYSQVPGGGSS
jgi:Multiubiquitin